MKRFLIGLFALLCLTGCSLKEGTELMQLPKPNKDRQAITDELARVRPADAVEDAPYDGKNRNTVQMVDLDGDGIEEVVAFFRVPANGNTYEAIVLTKRDEEEYTLAGRIRGIGTQIHSVDYPILSSDGQRGILVTLEKIGEQGRHLIAASYTDGKIEILLEADYIDLLTVDLDGDGAQDLFTISGPDNRRTAAIYIYNQQDNTLRIASETPLSSSAKIIQSVRAGMIAGNVPAVFVEETLSGAGGQQTDLFIYQPDKGLRNMALNTESGTGRGTYRIVPADACDINGDGLTEIPHAVHMVGSTKEDVDAVYMLDWYLYGIYGDPTYVKTTYRNVSQEWDFTISQSWYDTVHAVKGSNNGTDYTTFETYAPDGSTIPLLTIYYLLGDSDEIYNMIKNNELFALDETVSGVFAAEIPASAQMSTLALTPQQVIERFSLVKIDWNERQS